MTSRFDASRVFAIVGATFWIALGCSGDTTSSSVTPGATGTGAAENGGSGGASSSSGGGGGRVGSGGRAGSTASGGVHPGGAHPGGTWYLDGALNVGGANVDADVGGSSGADASIEASVTGGRGGSGTGGASGAGAAPGSGGAPADAPLNACGAAQPCLSTRCAGWNCGPAVCCTLQSQLMCVHGTTDCPTTDGGGSSTPLHCMSDFKDAYVFSKACTQKSDCFVGAHWAGCCNQHAIGLNVSEQSRFGSFEATCGGHPVCGCCCDRVTTDDGTVVAVGGSFAVDCIAGLCTSSIL